MWDRFLIECDWLLTLESKKQIFLWHVYLYIQFRKQETNIPLTCIFIYTVQTKLVQCIPTPLPITWGGGGGGGRKEKKKKKTKEKNV